MPRRVGLDTGVRRRIWGACRVEEAEQSNGAGEKEVADEGHGRSRESPKCPWCTVRITGDFKDPRDQKPTAAPGTSAAQ